MTIHLRRGRTLAVLAATCVAVLAVGTALAVADPGDPARKSSDHSAGELDRTRAYSICNFSGVDLQLVNLFTDAAAMFDVSPSTRALAQYPVLSTLRDNTCDDYHYGIEMHNTHNTSAVYMNADHTALVNIKGTILPSSDGPQAWHTNTEFKYVFDSRAGYVGPKLLVKVDTGSHQVRIVQGGVLGDEAGSTGSLDTGSLDTGLSGTGSLDSNSPLAPLDRERGDR